MPTLDQALPDARATMASFVESFYRSNRLVVFCHFDADGLAAGALLCRGLGRLGFADVEVVPSERGESAFSDAARERIAAHDPDGLIVTDLGVHRDGVLPAVPTLFIDHHRPEGRPAGAAVISAYGWDPIPCSAWLAYDLLAPLADVTDLSWIAAVGTLSDLGDKAPWPELPEVKKRYTARWLKEAVSLVNAARRASAFDVETPLSLLLEAEGPRAISEDDAHGADRLRAYRAEVNAALAEGRKRAPVFSAGGPWALVTVDSTCQIHPLIAQQWRGRLPNYAVIAANRGYLPGVVAFSARTARTDLNLPVILQGIDLGEFNGRFGYGHDQASGGQLPPEAFGRLLEGLGFKGQGVTRNE